MESKLSEVINLYALFSLSNPELINAFRNRIVNHEKVAAKLVATTHYSSGAVSITTIENKQYHFPLDLTSRTYHSKCNWIWVAQIDISFPSEQLITLSIDPRVIDIPYIGSKVCAHWLFKDVYTELSEQLNNYL